MKHNVARVVPDEGQSVLNPSQRFERQTMTASFELKINEEGPVDVEAVMRQIRQYLVARNRELPAGASGAALHIDGPLEPDIYEHIYLASTLHNRLYVPSSVVRSQAPLIGPLLNFLRGKLHELTLYYVNQLAEKQDSFNAHVLAALNGLTDEVEALKRSENGRAAHG